MTEPYGARVPGRFDAMVIAATSRLPDNWLGLRLAIALRRLVTMRLAGDGGLDGVRWGLRMRLHPRDNGSEKGALFTPQMFEARERAEMFAEIDEARAASRPFMFVDIGANVGLFSLLAASYAGGDATILAVEPEPENLRRLRFNVAANSGLPIQVIGIALGERAGTLALEIDRCNRGGTRTRPATPDDPADVRVECRTLLDLLKAQDVRSIDVLKIDVEGMEAAILLPFFSNAPKSLWPNLIIIEEPGERWCRALVNYGYALSARSKLNVMMRRGAGANS